MTGGDDISALLAAARRDPRLARDVAFWLWPDLTMREIEQRIAAGARVPELRG